MKALTLLAGTVSVVSLLGTAEIARGAVDWPCQICLAPYMPCLLDYVASGRVTARRTGLPIPDATVTVSSPPPFGFSPPVIVIGSTDGDGSYILASQREDSCRQEYVSTIEVSAAGFKTASGSVYYSEHDPIYQDFVLDEIVAPVDATLAVTPDTIHLTCEGAFEIHLTNTQSPGGLSIDIGDLDFFHEYSQGFYGMGFAWDLAEISLPVLLAPGASVSIPVTYHAGDYASLLHMRVDSNAANIEPSTFFHYYGGLCTSPTPTPFGGPPATETPTPTSTPGGIATPTDTAVATPTEAAPIPTPTPLSPNLTIDPPSIELSCSGSFEVQLTNTQLGGIPLVIDGIEVFQEYSQGYYGTGFTWDLSGITLPLVLEAQMSVRFPVSYEGADQTYPSLLHVTVDSNAVEVAPAFVSYFGGLCGTPTPTVRDTRPTISATPTRPSTPTFTIEPSRTAPPSASATPTTSLVGGARTATSSGGGCQAGSESSAAWIALALLPLLRRKRA